jgi:hypothetical protein
MDVCRMTSAKQPPALPYLLLQPRSINTCTNKIANFDIITKPSKYTHDALYLIILHYIFSDIFLLTSKYNVFSCFVIVIQCMENAEY